MLKTLCILLYFPQNQLLLCSPINDIHTLNVYPNYLKSTFWLQLMRKVMADSNYKQMFKRNNEQMWFTNHLSCKGSALLSWTCRFHVFTTSFWCCTEIFHLKIIHNVTTRYTPQNKGKQYTLWPDLCWENTKCEDITETNCL